MNMEVVDAFIEENERDFKMWCYDHSFEETSKQALKNYCISRSIAFDDFEYNYDGDIDKTTDLNKEI